MNLDRLTLPRSTPPLEQVARALFKRGAREAGLRLLRAVVERDPREKGCAALLAAVEARPQASVYGPDLELDVRLAEVFACCGWFREALAILEGTGLDRAGLGRAHAEALREILAPIPVGAKTVLREVDDQIRHGGAATALSTLDEDGSLPSWAVRRRVLLRRLLLESGSAAAGQTGGVEVRETAFAVCVRPHLEGRDLKTAYAAACALCERDPSDVNAREGTDALAQLVCELAASDAADEEGAGKTRELSGLQLARFQLTMGNLESVERLLRNLASEDPTDLSCRELLRALLVFRAALDGRAGADDVGAVDPSDATLPGVTPKAHELRDMARALVMAAEGTALPAVAGSPLSPCSLGSYSVDDDGRDEADRAELLYSRGFAEQALVIYRKLTTRFPNRRRYSDRAADIRNTLRSRLQKAAEATHFAGVEPLAWSRASTPPPSTPSLSDLEVGPTPPAGATRQAACADPVLDAPRRTASLAARGDLDTRPSSVHVCRIVRVT